MVEYGEGNRSGRAKLNWFLVQVNKDAGYHNITRNGRYVNEDWRDKSRKQAQGEVERGDMLLAYCTSDVPDYGKSLAFSVVVREVSPDKVTIEVDEPHLFRSPLCHKRIHDLVDEGELASTFSQCGNQAFTIAKLEPFEAQKALKLVGAESSGVQEADAG